MLKTARCGNLDGDFENSDIKYIKPGNNAGDSGGKGRVKRFAVGGNRWDTHRLSFDVRNTPYTLSQGQVRRAFRKALGMDFNYIINGLGRYYDVTLSR